MTKQQKTVSVNERTYKWPNRPVVAVCVDGSQPEYIEEAIKAGVMPWTAQVVAGKGSDLRADCVVPSFTNPNNISIVTGVEPSVHGICGNFYYDRESDKEVMMNEPHLLRTDTIFKAFQDAGAKVAIITAKDKLRRLLGNGLAYGENGAICFSSEKSNEATFAEHGIEDVLDMVGMKVPSVYSGELSEFIFAAGVKLMEKQRPDIMYLSTTDYIQHKFAPGSEGANKFYAMMDSYWAQLDELGAIVALTADHGMNAKHDESGKPDVIYLQSLLDEKFGTGKARVILPITDPYVVHHGALGSFATVYLDDEMNTPVRDYLKTIDGMQEVLSNAEGCKMFGLAPDRTGDIIVVSNQQKVLGTSESRHDLSGLEVPLRSHGGMTEQCVPLVVSTPVSGVEPDRLLRNFDIYDIALNYTSA